MFRLLINTLKAMIMLTICFGCRVGPAYHPPCPEAPEEWKASDPVQGATPYFECWWEIFNDSQLDALEKQAIANNPNIYVALERVLEAKALAGVKKADLYPQLNLDGNYSDTGQLIQFFLPPGVVLPTTDKVSPFFRIHQFLYSLIFNITYEVDLWGRIRANYESAVYNAEAQLQDYYTSLLSLTADVASHYFQMRYYDAEADLLQSTIQNYQKNYQFNQSRYQKGIANLIDMTNASLQVSNAQANLEETLRLRTIEENAIAALIGENASEFSLFCNPLKGSPPMIPAGLPASLLIRRPDIAEAERNMAAEHASIHAAYASFLPSLSLTGALGYSSPDFKQFLTWISRYWSIGAMSRQHIFDGGRDLSNLWIAWARYKEASGAYQQQVLVAFQEVENALSSLEMQSKQAVFLKTSVDAAIKTDALSNTRYKNGLVTYLEVVDSERARLNAELNEIMTKSAQFLSTIQLIKALGGSWDMEPKSCIYAPFKE